MLKNSLGASVLKSFADYRDYLPISAFFLKPNQKRDKATYLQKSRCDFLLQRELGNNEKEMDGFSFRRIAKIGQVEDSDHD